MTIPASTTIKPLVNDADWQELLFFLSPELKNAAAGNLVEQLRAANAGSVLIETEYLDRDYSAEYSAFYSRLFRVHRRKTTRLHFFKINLADVQSNGLLAVRTEMEAASRRNEYLGFVIVRPVADASIGRAVLNVAQSTEDLRTTVQVRALYETHPLGAELCVRGMPFTQQDQRISACAQASIWMVGRHFHTRHAGPWFSTVAITEAASSPTDMILSSSLPAGSSGLGINNMLRALRAMDRYPYAFSGQIIEQIGLVWDPALPPQEILARYVGSGIPVIACLAPWGPGHDGHAVVVVGDTFKCLEDTRLHTSHPTVSEFSPYYLVHDDQRGMNLKMPVKAGTTDAETPYNVEQHLQFIIVPLPDKVFIPAELAEIKAWDRLEFYRREWPGLKAKHEHEIGTSVALAERVVDGLGRTQVIARTYLTHSWKYKWRLQQQGAVGAVVSQAALIELPKMVWVTEFALLEDMNKLEPDERRIFGHCVTDATSTGPMQSPLIIHLPGFFWTYSSLNPEFYPDSEEQLVPIADDVVYRPRIRAND